MRLFIIVGTRPEIIRLSTTIRLARQLFDVTLVHTGQNYDYNLNDVFFHDLSIDPPDIYLDCSRNNIGSTIGNIISKSYDLFVEHQPDAILILGDTNSCLCSYSAKRLKIPIFHVEAGNRCFDPNVPEEINRKMIDHLSDVNMCYMEHARTNLIKENLKSQYIFVVGSPMPEIYDNIKSRVESSQILSELNIVAHDYFVWSSHREENVDSKNLEHIIESINQLAGTYDKKVVFSIHPRTRKKLNLNRLHTNIIINEPFGIIDYYKLQQNALCVVSDSGTLTEESAIIGFRSVLLRTSTEHPEGIDAGSIVVGNVQWKFLSKAIEICLKTDMTFNNIAAYQDKNVSEKICKIIGGYTDIVNKFGWMK
jgi:UDP-N-acetylglucosamine 2-epimerase (non-hydrolysing)